MTFVPTPKSDLASLDALSEVWGALGQQLLSRLHHGQVDSDWAAAAIADLYARLPGAASVWRWAGTVANVDPGSGRLTIAGISGNNRQVTVSKTDANGGYQTLDSIEQGSTLVLTDDPASPPVTAFRQYVVSGDPVDHGSWVSFPAVRLAVYGNATTPPVNSRVRLLMR